MVGSTAANEWHRLEELLKHISQVPTVDERLLLLSYVFSKAEFESALRILDERVKHDNKTASSSSESKFPSRMVFFDNNDVFSLTDKGFPVIRSCWFCGQCRNLQHACEAGPLSGCNLQEEQGEETAAASQTVQTNTRKKFVESHPNSQNIVARLSALPTI